MRHFLPLLLVGMSVPAVAGDVIPPVVDGHTWVQHRIELIKAKNPAIAWIRVEGVRDGGSDVILFGATDARASVLKPVAYPVSALGASKEGRGEVVREPFVSNSGHRLGTVAVGFTKPGRRDPAIAAAVARELSRNMLSAKNAADPWPYSAAYRGDTYAQRLVDRFVGKYPDLLVMMIHATPPGHSAHDNVIIGSNIGRIGKLADDDDLRVIEKGETNLEVAESGDRFETELPLNNAKGTRIGALGLVFKLKPGADRNALHAHGRAIRDALAKEIPNDSSLFKRSR
jgi:hypothetical protein